MLQKKLLLFFQTKDYKIQKILEGINFNLHLSYLSDILGVLNQCNCYHQGPGSTIVDFAIKLTTSGVVISPNKNVLVRTQAYNPHKLNMIVDRVIVATSVS